MSEIILKSRDISELGLDEIQNYLGDNVKSRMFLEYISRGYECRCWCCEKVANKLVHYQQLNNPATGWALAHVTNFHTFILFNADHIVPRSRGGTDHLLNLRPSCHLCNSRRQHNMTEEEELFALTVPEVTRFPFKSLSQIGIKYNYEYPPSCRYNTNTKLETIVDRLLKISRNLPEEFWQSDNGAMMNCITEEFSNRVSNIIMDELNKKVKNG